MDQTSHIDFCVKPRNSVSNKALTAHILVVEDNHDLSSAINDILCEAGYSVTTVRNGLEGLELAKFSSNHYSAIILDIRLPGITGTEFLSQLKTSRDTPVLVLTSYDSVAHRRLFKQLGAARCLTKPFEPNQLLKDTQGILKKNMSTCGFSQNPILEKARQIV